MTRQLPKNGVTIDLCICVWPSLSGHWSWEVQHCLPIRSGSFWPQHKSHNRVRALLQIAKDGVAEQEISQTNKKKKDLSLHARTHAFFSPEISQGLISNQKATHFTTFSQLIEMYNQSFKPTVKLADVLQKKNGLKKIREIGSFNLKLLISAYFLRVMV